MAGWFTYTTILNSLLDPAIFSSSLRTFAQARYVKGSRKNGFPNTLPMVVTGRLIDAMTNEAVVRGSCNDIESITNPSPSHDFS